VLVVEDSAFMRKVISDILCSDDSLSVVGVARNGLEALEKVRELKPDVVTMDVEMPFMDGITCTARLMTENPVPVVMLSSTTQKGASKTLEALAAGAVDFIPKPSGSVSLDLDLLRETIVSKVKSAAGARARAITVTSNTIVKTSLDGLPPSWLVAIACSTGGPGALCELFSRLEQVDASVCVIQHMPPGFTKSLSARLDDCSVFRVREASNGECLEAGHAYVAPGGLHMSLDSRLRLRVHDGPPIHGVKPAADLFMQSCAKWAAPNIIGIVLTGMGCDGAKGMMAIRDAGGRTIAEHESTSVVYGMPKAAVASDAAEMVLPLHTIPEKISEITGFCKEG